MSRDKKPGSCIRDASLCSGRFQHQSERDLFFCYCHFCSEWVAFLYRPGKGWHHVAAFRVGANGYELVECFDSEVNLVWVINSLKSLMFLWAPTAKKVAGTLRARTLLELAAPVRVTVVARQEPRSGEV